MSLSVSPAPHAYLLADDFLTLDHWFHYGANEREYSLRPDVSVGAGNALAVADEGVLRLARENGLVPGVPVVVSWWAYRHAPGFGPATFQLRNATGGGFFDLLQTGNSNLQIGWNHCVAAATPPADWGAVLFSMYAASHRPGGMVAQLRITKAKEDDQ